ncbi:hypothetical protein DRN58_01985, partial [Thermococci archaeon]
LGHYYGELRDTIRKINELSDKIKEIKTERQVQRLRERTEKVAPESFALTDTGKGLYSRRFNDEGVLLAKTRS